MEKISIGDVFMDTMSHWKYRVVHIDMGIVYFHDGSYAGYVELNTAQWKRV